ncbi:MAG: polyprenyl synthetase family protein [Chlorobi bacterium]|nr:polyprenyl synthetase family protein [Chlorobiota bacterium]
MKTVARIKAPIEAEMEMFERKFREAVRTRVPLLNRITMFIVTRKGKRMRPMFVFLTAKMLAGHVTERTYRGASIIELIHTATIVHDDVVDESTYRRGFFSLNAVWRNKIAVLVGDYLLAKGLILSIDNDDFDLLRIISVAVREMSEGELLQIEKARKLDIDEETYYDIIRKKTASLIAACTAMGAASVGMDVKTVNDMHRFGELTGMAFQIKDDLFDYTGGDIGKPTGIDIKERKMTLPLIHVLNKVSPREKKWMLKILKKHNTDKQKVQELIAFIKQKGGLDYAVQKMHAYKDEALRILERYPDNEAKESLKLMLDYVINRKL